ncbi:Cobalt-precorrin-8x methylmutase [Leptospirillum ferriphilum]|jgi:precorrin-8X/cobalt-precorrin-8 methylmutase|uniref:Cobalt-precorrin-8x methylmutase n=2 Tax=Leptospirillum TaxID=179 RepID=A0A094WDK5_9BACT|nr:precorrin-8X methylmutase [Leptospirillum ferriphilum]EDZ38988.1 MAG: Putative precorrin-8X methylmutase (CbiC) [Leptospirillum sp. Group II '5-way CG']KGA93732.1 Cobalt-precorrin-8x methylmutase [Leptospirillum ferriphilum]
MTPSVLIISEKHHLHLEGVKVQLEKRGGFKNVAVFAFLEGREAFGRKLGDLLSDSRRLAVVTFEENPAAILEQFDQWYRDAMLPEADIRPVFGLLETPSFIRALSTTVRQQFDPEQPPEEPPVPEPDKIEEESFRIIDEVLSGYGFEEEWHQVVRRAVHAAADFEVADRMDHHVGAIDTAVRAIHGGANIIVDVQMVESGISKPLTGKFKTEIRCFVGDEDVASRAKAEGVTRSTIAMRKAVPYLSGSIVVVGNAPTALFEVLRLIRKEGVRPALVVGVPVGFVGAAESKELLSRQDIVPWITTRGPKGGSTVAVAIMNALLRIADAQEKRGAG